MENMNDIDLMDLEDLEKLLVKNGGVDAMFYLRDIKQRKLYLTDVVDQLAVDDLVSNIIQYNREDKDIPVDQRRPILLYISSMGGEVDAGFELIDIIQSSKTPVYTLNIGCWYSMAFLIGIAGHKRFAMKNAKFLTHDGSISVYNSGAKIQDQMAFQRRVEEKIREFVVERTNITREEYEDKLRVEWYLFADEAKLKGVVDHIIGVDCDIDEIV